MDRFVRKCWFYLGREHDAISRIAQKAIKAAASFALILVWVVPAAASAAPASQAARQKPASQLVGAGRVHGLGARHAQVLPALTTKSATGAAATSVDAGSDPSDLQYGGGPIQHHPTFYAVFWLPSGTNYEPGIINGNSGYEGLMERYLQDAGSTSMANVADQYYDTLSGYPENIGPGTQFGSMTTYGGDWVDATPYPHSGSASDPLFDSDIQASVNRALAANPTWQDGVNSTIFVFTGYGINSCMTTSKSSCTGQIPSSQGYCAYHDDFRDGKGSTAVYANMPEDEYFNAADIFTTGEACESTNALPNGDIYADNELPILSHELWESATDPEPASGWTDSSGMEIGDKCQSNWGYQPYFGPSNVDVNGHLYYLQQEWSNADGGCAGAPTPGGGFYLNYGPYVATAGASTGTLDLGETVFIPSVNVILTPNPSVNWGDGSSNQPSGDTGCGICNLTSSHTYAYDPSATYPKTYQVTVTYNTGCCISYSQSFHIVVFGPQPLTITANNQTMTYGGTVPAFMASYSGFTNGDTSSVVHGLTCGATYNGRPVSSTTPAGSYPITCSGATAPSYYRISYAAGVLTINPAPLTITANNQATTYGHISFGKSAASMTFTGFVNGEGPSVLGPGLTIVSNVSPTSPVGFYTLTPAGAVDNNYAITYKSGTLTVGRAVLTIAANNQATTYGHISFGKSAASMTFTGFVNGDGPSVLGPGLTIVSNVSPTSPVGSYTLTPAGAVDNNYTITYKNGTLTVGRAVLTIAANNQSTAYGHISFDKSAASMTFTGFVNGDGPSVLGPGLTIVSNVSPTSPVGSYTLTPAGAVDNNYTITYKNGTLTVGRAVLTIAANNQSTAYGHISFDKSAASMTFTGFVNGDGPSVLGPGLTIVSNVSPTSPVGSYTLTPAGAVDNNYTITYKNGTLTVGPAALLITASSPSVTYNGSVPAVTPIYGGLVNGQTVPATPPTCTSTAPANGDAGSYSTSCSGAEDPNYTISYASGTMTISQASTTTVLTSTPDPSVFGQTVTLTATVSVVSPGAGDPTGTVEFEDAGIDISGCASQPVDGGLATCTTLRVGRRIPWHHGHLQRRSELYGQLWDSDANGQRQAGFAALHFSAVSRRWSHSGEPVVDCTARSHEFQSHRN